MGVKNKIYLASIVVSFISVFVSYLLGQLAANKKFKRDQRYRRYNSLYIPLMEMLYKQRIGKYDFYNLLVFDKFQPFEKLLINNVQFMGKKSAKKLYFIVHQGKSAVIKQNSHNLELLSKGQALEPLSPEAQDAINEYNALIEQLLLEAEKLAKQLKLDPISEPLRLALQKDQNCQSK